MDAIEKAIRNALEKGNAEDRAYREKVYRSAFAALDRALQANPGITVENAIKRRKAMQAKIAEIESEFLPAVAVRAEESEREDNGAAPSIDSPAARGSANIPSVDAPVVVAEPGSRVEPPLGSATVNVPPGAGDARARVSADFSDIKPEPALAATSPSGPAAEISADRDERRVRPRRFPLGAVLGVLLLAGAGYGIWWSVENGLLQVPGGSGRTAPAAQEAAPSVGAGETDQERQWVVVFTPNDPTLVSAPSDAEAEVMQDDDGIFLRVRSGPSGSAVSFDVGQGILEQLAGRHAVFDIVARAGDGNDTQMSVDCNFGELGDCGRRRYVVGREKNEYLFDLGFPDTRPNAAGTIAINSDFEGQGRSVDIYEIRVSTTD